MTAYAFAYMHVTCLNLYEVCIGPQTIKAGFDPLNPPLIKTLKGKSVLCTLPFCKVFYSRFVPISVLKLEEGSISFRTGK